MRLQAAGESAPESRKSPALPRERKRQMPPMMPVKPMLQHAAGENGQIRYTCVSPFPYSPFTSRSVAVSQPIPIPHWQRFPRFDAVVAGTSRSCPSGRRLWYGFLIRVLSILAAFPAIRCHCGKRSCLTRHNSRDGRPSPVRIYTPCRHILPFCIVQHAARVYCAYCQLYTF